MKPTLEQLNEMTDYAINCDVRNKLRAELPTAGYCNNPNDYMPIAIEHGISPVFYKQADSMQAYLNNGQTEIGSVYPILPELVGKMLMIAFLLMEIDK